MTSGKARLINLTIVLKDLLVAQGPARPPHLEVAFLFRVTPG